MKTNLQSKKEGFTIIEVVLVLAIAGLIFLIVFLAVPQLQRSRRDTQRRTDASRILTELNNYASNNNGQYPSDQGELVTDARSFQTRYIDGLEFQDPQTGNDYDLTYNESTSFDPAIGEMQVAANSVCDGENISATGNARDIVVRTRLDNDNTYYCTDLN